MLEDKFIEINGRLYDEYGQLAKDESGAIGGTVKPNSFFSGLVEPVHKRPHSMAHHTKRQVQKSKTLLRKAVKKPKLSPKESAISSTSFALTELAKRNKEDKLLRARSVSKSPLINRFNNRQSGIQHYSGNVSDFVSPAHKPAQAKTHSFPEKKYNPFDDAIERAIVPKHHKSQPKARNHLSATTLFGILFILIGTIILFTQMPKLNAQIMAYKSGVSISFPENIPSGYKLDNVINYSKGSVTLNYYNGKNTFKIIEQPDNITANKGISNVSEIVKSANPVYSFTKSNTDYFLVTNNNLTDYDINNIFSSI